MFNSRSTMRTTSGCSMRHHFLSSKNPSLHQSYQLHRSYEGRCNKPLKPVTATHQPNMPEQGTTSGISALAAAGQQAEVAVRPLREEDKERWSELFRAYVTWYKATALQCKLRHEACIEQVSDEVMEQTWQNLMTGGDGNHMGLVAEQSSSGEVVGLAHFILHKSTWSKTYYCYLEDLYVDNKVRAHGVGKALIEAVYKAADDLGASKTYWHTQEHNYRARGLYDKMGKKSEFIHYERR